MKNKNNNNNNNISNIKNDVNIINNNDIKLNKNFLKLIFSLNILFNHIIIIKNINKDDKKSIKDKNDKEEDNNNNIDENNKNKNIININNVEYEIKIISKLKCSSISRQFLLNILNIFKEEKVYLYNYMLETHVLSDIIKIDTRNLFQKTRAKEKIIILFDEILEKLKEKESIKNIFNIFYNENK